jgi:hypothetical protein
MSASRPGSPEPMGGFSLCARCRSWQEDGAELDGEATEQESDPDFLPDPPYFIFGSYVGIPWLHQWTAFTLKRLKHGAVGEHNGSSDSS